MEPLKIGNIILPHRAVFGPDGGLYGRPLPPPDGAARRRLYGQRNGIQPGTGVRRP